MFNKSGISRTSYGNINQILVNTEFQLSVGVVVSSALGVADGAKSIAKAGTPVTGSLDARTTPFTAAVTASGASNAVGVLLHDVDVTNGNANGTLLIFGFVNTNRLESTVQALITSEVKTALNAKVTFLAM